MLLTIFTAWKILGVIAIILLILFWKKRNAVWGGLFGGAIIGLIIAFIVKGPFDWYIIVKSATIGVFIGVFAELLGKLSDKLRRK